MDSLLAASTAYGTGRSAGVVAVVVLAAALIRQFVWLRNNQSTGWKRMLVVGGIAVMVIVNIDRLLGDDDPWATGRGADMKAGFMDACRSTSSGIVDCDCAFQRMTATAPYDTPDGLATLTEPAFAAQQSGNPQDIPPVLLSAFQSCLVRGSQPVAPSTGVG